MSVITEVFGGILAGVILNAWLYGLICVLSYQYYVTFPSDGKGTKLLVAWMVILQLFNAIALSKMVYYYLVTSFGNPENLGIAVWEWSMKLGLSSISAFSVQAYYARRTYLLSNSRVLFLVIIGLAIVQLGFGLATMSEAFKLVVIARFTSVTWVDVIWLACSAACDLVIGTVQVMYLHRHRSGLPGTNRIVKILTLYILSTGLLTSIVAIVQLTTFASVGFGFTNEFLSIAIGAVYGVSLLANLDARRIVRGANTDPGTMDLDNLRTSRDRDHTLNLDFKKNNIVKSDSTLEPFQSNRSKVSDLHVHPELISDGSVSENV